MIKKPQTSFYSHQTLLNRSEIKNLTFISLYKKSPKPSLVHRYNRDWHSILKTLNFSLTIKSHPRLTKTPKNPQKPQNQSPATTI